MEQDGEKYKVMRGSFNFNKYSFVCASQRYCICRNYK